MATHVLRLSGDSTVEVEFWANYSESPNSELVFMVGPRVGVLWGQQLIRLGPQGEVERLSEILKMELFQGQSFRVRSKLIRTGETLQVVCNGLRVAEHTFAKGELDGRFGVRLRSTSAVVTEVRLRGQGAAAAGGRRPRRVR